MRSSQTGTCNYIYCESSHKTVMFAEDFKHRMMSLLATLSQLNVSCFKEGCMPMNDDSYSSPFKNDKVFLACTLSHRIYNVYSFFFIADITE